ncbi:adenine-specific DNA-methyltransferase [Clostridium acetobutylicum]|uniref:Site-specific modification DNA-methyltransferase n=1 Tax=Clostridium acetobutylicum (strain ATCC 824 / DSM 792 / JCM 1419 / IAM 19013 / LMG 5710 / NBRC 13948 / NRRL B-527 / VKM B-1787 / 2291 / W) TaxID=272562 RepID=Q97DE4_CLOAB|nr:MULTISPECIES: class I SAM-dependent methyltransferase [Clostridium]AAK81459.1 Site-specific modification DNA-methyltransferase [Clostridium acetobutylicum ATCC 824]ADZ22577.1 Site-specific modification DNA-methyltransferase [Clostridium acetobutylicum EA 2018]AEI34157.1 site-specific modification DNA-methyltransferase [Clostridium acetobutylicum DSM 1731]AWV80868.1 class I SAM-dependent methyltransferase [Clostridium acetobutylicum]MBC2393805.1 class I SAM-dependent methyltransferase [Clost
MLLRKDATEERLTGRYFTPKDLASYIIDWVIQDNNINKILEPSCGNGVFLECLGERRLEDGRNITAIEIDEDVSFEASMQIDNSLRFNNCYDYQRALRNDGDIVNNGIVIINDDFYKVYEQELQGQRFQAIVGNPPYIRYQYLSEQQREEQSKILIRNNMRPNKLINAWVSFVVACAEILDGNGKMGLVIPAELLQVAYAEDLRRFIMRTFQRITIVTFRELVFPNVQQEVVLLLVEKEILHTREHQLRIVEYQDINELTESNDLDEYPFNDVEINESKWTKYFLSANDIRLINNIRENDKFVRFSDVARVEVGITTGNNDYFCVNRRVVEEYDLERVCRPLIARSVNINGVKFTYEDWKSNIENGAKTYLIDFPDVPYDEYQLSYKQYIEYGIHNDKNSGYKCRIRDRWYKVPSIWVPDAFFLRRNHLYPKFVLNSQEVNAVSTDTMHRVRFNNHDDRERILLSYYNSIALAFTEIEGRSYGGGVLEILPREVGRIIMPDLRNRELIDDATVSNLLNRIDGYIRSNDNILGIVDEIDEIILVEIMGVDENVVREFRNIWLTLQRRRLNRR